MNIGIDVTATIYQRGVSRYTSNLVLALSQHPEAKIFLYGSSLRQHQQLVNFYPQLPGKFQHYPPAVLSKMWNMGLNPIKKILPQIQVFHSWDWMQPPDKHLPLVSTIHDLAILEYPETAHPQILKMHQKSWQVLKDRQAQIIAVSRSTKKDIINFLDIPEDKVHVIYEALPIETVRITETMTDDQFDLIKQQLRLDKPYLLFVGTREPRKNLQRLIQAWLPLANNFQLIVAGEAGWDASSPGDVIPQLTLRQMENLKFLGKVSNQELAVLYESAACFVYPSLYEGFGLPILEAFYHGTPAVTSNISSMPEVAGNAAELVDPESIEDISQGIDKILQESISEQQQRMQKMVIRLQLFDWKRVADQTMQVYRQAYEQNF